MNLSLTKKEIALTIYLNININSILVYEGSSCTALVVLSITKQNQAVLLMTTKYFCISCQVPNNQKKSSN